MLGAFFSEIDEFLSIWTENHAADAVGGLLIFPVQHDNSFSPVTNISNAFAVRRKHDRQGAKFLVGLADFFIDDEKCFLVAECKVAKPLAVWTELEKEVRYCVPWC